MTRYNDNERFKLCKFAAYAKDNSVLREKIALCLPGKADQNDQESESGCLKKWATLAARFVIQRLPDNR